MESRSASLCTLVELTGTTDKTDFPQKCWSNPVVFYSMVSLLYEHNEYQKITQVGKGLSKCEFNVPSLISKLVRDVKLQEMHFYRILLLPLPGTSISRWQGWHCTVISYNMTWIHMKSIWFYEIHHNKRPLAKNGNPFVFKMSLT